jgi:hypothetical protein
MAYAGYGRWLRIPPGPAGGRPTLLFILDNSVAERIAAEVQYAPHPTKPTEGAKRGRCAHSTPFLLTDNQRECLHRMAKDVARALSQEDQPITEQTLIDLCKPGMWRSLAERLLTAG